MSALPGLTYSSPGVPLYEPFGSATGINLSTINVANTYLWEGATISTNVVGFYLSAPSTSQISQEAGGLYATHTFDGASGDLEIYAPGAVNIPSPLNASTLSTGSIECDTISTTKIDLDGQVLTADATDLLLNGIPVATISSLSSIADWALEPAISSVNMSAYDLLSTGTGVFSTVRGDNISTGSIFADTGVFRDISTTTLTSFSTLTIISTVSSLVLEAQLVNTSTLYASGFLSTPDIEVSTINGAQFGNSSITVDIVGVSSLVANSISSAGAVLKEALVSTLQFNPSFSPSLNVDLGLGSLFGNLAGAASGAIGVVVGGAALGTGIAALNQSRQTNYINSNSYELVNGTTQLQISTLGIPFSTVYRFVSSVSETTPGEEYFISTIHSPGVAIRSLSDPLNTVSAPTSTIQSFGQWVALDANLPIPSSVSTYQQLFTSSLGATSPATRVDVLNNMNMSSGTILTVDKLQGDELQVNAIGAFGLGFVDLFANVDNTGYFFSTSELLASSINGSAYPPPAPTSVSSFSSIYIGVNGLIDMTQDGSINLGAGGNANGQLNSGANPSLILDGATSEVAVPILNVDRIGSKNTGTIEIQGGTTVSASTSQMYLSSLGLNTATMTSASISSATVSSLAFSQSGLSSLVGISTAQITGFGTSTCMYINTDVSLGQNDLFVQQIRLGYTNPTNSQSEIIFYDANGATRGFNSALQDRAIRYVSTVNGTGGGYLLDTSINPPFFSTINGNVNLMAFFPSTTNSTIGASTISIIPSGVGNTSNLFTSTINSIGSVSSLVITPNASTSMSMTTVGDVDFVTRDFFAQATTGGVVKATLLVNSSGAGGNGLFALGADVGVGTLYGSTINISTNRLAVNGVTWPSLAYFASAYNSTSQTVAGANVSTLANLNTTAVNVGGFTVSSSNIAVPVAGTYEVNASFQFATTSGSANLAQFWLIKNGAAVPQTNSRVTVANNADNLGTISVFDTAAAGDTYGWMFYSADANMSATAVAAGATPAIPSLIFNIKRLG